MTTPSPASSAQAADADLVARIARGDRAAFEMAFREHYTALVRFAEGILRSRELGEDAVQEVMLNLWRQREVLRIDDSLRAYLYAAVRNRALNGLRNDRVRRDAVPHLVREMPETPAGEAVVLEGEIEAAVRAAIDTLPPRCREIFELSRFKGLRYSEIAESLGISVKTVETQMGRALKSLRQQLSPFLMNDAE